MEKTFCHRSIQIKKSVCVCLCVTVYCCQPYRVSISQLSSASHAFSESFHTNHPLSVCAFSLAIRFTSGKPKSAESWRGKFLCMNSTPCSARQDEQPPDLTSWNLRWKKENEKNTPLPDSDKLFMQDRDKTGHHLHICHFLADWLPAVFGAR